MHLAHTPPTIKTGNEQLFHNSKQLGFSLFDFWRWSVSDILSNATRGRFAEFIVATATGIDMKTVRDEWGAFDLETPDGIKLEIKSSAYAQSWHQRAHSKITFSIKPTAAWDKETNTYSTEKKRHADVYVFCLLHHKDKATIDPLNMNQWEFYVLPTQALNDYTRSQHSITLASLQRLTKAVEYDKLDEVICAVGAGVII
jgi:hypothetical protein